jgi:N-acetylmuramoyl-L-alanine amidase
VKICIDPGHGGRDPGAVSPDGIKESLVNLKCAKLLERYLIRAGHTVILTRRNDVEVDLATRCAYANEQQADIFVSIHANAAVSADANGYEVFYHPGSLKGYQLACDISEAYKVATGLPCRRVASANFQVLRDTYMPAVLLEVGFLTNKGDCALLKEPAFIDKAAMGITFGVI